MKLTSAVIAEWMAAGLIIVALLWTAYFYVGNGYLPPPFFHDPDDTFMDWYNTAYWANKPGAYSDWASVYPPLSFIFPKLLTIPACFEQSSDVGRHCDRIGAGFLSLMVIVNVFIAWRVFHRRDESTSYARAIALGLGMPALFAWERGNLIVPCLTALMLCHGRIVKSNWVRAFIFAVTVNMKPYLLLTETGALLKGRWRWLERAAGATVLVYAFSYMIMGMGSPMEVIYNIRGFAIPPEQFSIGMIEYTTTYTSLLQAFRTNLPIESTVGSRLVEGLQAILPFVMGVGGLGVCLCFLGAAWRPNILPASRLSAMAMALLLSIAPSPGGYSAVFMLFFVLLEPCMGVGSAIALVSAYFLCIPFDLPIISIAHLLRNAWLSGLTIDYDLSISIGEIMRPALILLIELGLIVQSLKDIIRLTAPVSSSDVTVSGEGRLAQD